MQIVSTLARVATGIEAIKRIVVAGIIIYIVLHETYKQQKKLDVEE